MKVVLGLILIASAVAEAKEYQSSLVQINTFVNPSAPPESAPQITRALVANLPDSGSSQAPSSIMGRTTFQLIADEILTPSEIAAGEVAEMHVLDETAMASYLAEGKVSITGPQEDDYNTNKPADALPRTKVGEGFTVNFDVSGLESPSGVSVNGLPWPLAATELKVQQEVEDYNNLNSKSYFEAGLKQNGVQVIPKTTNLSVSDSHLAYGKETFRVFMLADPPFAENLLDEASIVVFPKERGSLSGLSDSGNYDVVPAVRVNVENMYPNSRVYLSITGANLTKRIRYGWRKNTDVVPYSPSFNLKDLDSRLVADGAYKVDLVYKDYFDTVVLDTVTFDLKRTISVKGSVYSAD